MVLCRVIMGNMELLRGDKAQFFSGGEEYDNGVDDVENPKNYIVWNMNMNTHVFPEYVVRFKLSDPTNAEHQWFKLYDRIKGIEQLYFGCL